VIEGVTEEVEEGNEREREKGENWGVLEEKRGAEKTP
jgi:hypothetical protein